MLSTFFRSQITEICAAIPKTEVAVATYASTLLNEKESKRMVKSTGFASLRISDETTTTADLCQRAAENLSTLDAVDALIFVTQTPDYILPATVRGLQHRLGLSKNTLCFELNEGCAGYVHGLYLAATLIEAKQCRKVLLLCGDTSSKLTCPTDRSTRCIFGDAGSATFIEERAAKYSTMFFHLETWGERENAVIVENSRHRLLNDSSSDCYLSLDGMAVMNFTLDEVPTHIRKMLSYAGKQLSDISLFACHQANKLILTSLASALGVSDNILPFVASNTGNTSSASIPLLFS